MSVPPLRRRRCLVEAAVHAGRGREVVPCRAVIPFGRSLLLGAARPVLALSNLADRAAVVLAIDDLHWSDTESLRFLNYLRPRLDGLRVAVIASTRSGQRSSELTSLATSPEATVLRPAPLSIDATATLCARCLGSIAERARTELRAARGRSSGSEGGGLEALTASERRIAELAADGHSNPEIAQAMHVTRKTVETHLGHIYRKLGITGRQDLARMLGGDTAASGMRAP